MKKITSKQAQDKEQSKGRSQRGQGRLYKRDNSGKEHPADYKGGCFYLEYKANGKRIKQRLTDRDGEPVTTRKEAEAERIRIMAPFAAKETVEQLKAIQAKLADAETLHAQAVEEANPPLTVADAWNAYLRSNERPDSGEDMQTRYAGYWKRLTDWLQETAPETKYLRDITPQTAQDYAATLNGGTVSPNTFNKHTGFLRLFFGVLKEPARMQDNPFERIRRKKLKTNVRRELTLAELKDILEKAKGELQTLLYIGTFTGLRLGDCCTLKWGEVDLDRGLIRRVPNKTASKKQKPVLIGIPSALHAKLAETPPSRRKGYVLPEYAELYNYRNESGIITRQAHITREIQAHFTACGIQTTKEGTGIVKDPETGKEQPTGKRAVIEVGFHSLRHTYVSLHAERGTPQSVIQANVGHGSPAMTAHYTHVNEDTARRVAGVLTLNEPEHKTTQTLPAWVAEKLEGMTAKNWKQIKAELTGKEG